MSVAAGSKVAADIKAVVVAHDHLCGIPFLSDEYFPAFKQLEKAVLSLISNHRNWNEVTEEIDENESHPDDRPAGARPPRVAAEDITEMEDLYHEVFYHFKLARLDNPTLITMRSAETMQNRISDLISWHPDYDQDHQTLRA